MPYPEKHCQMIKKKTYYIDFQQVSLKELKDLLINADLLKSRQIIKKDIHENFKKLEDQGVANVRDLKQVLKTPEKRKIFSLKSGIDAEYLTILNREIARFSQKPNRFVDFPEISPQLKQKLKNSGILNTRQFFESFMRQSGMEGLIKQSGLSLEEVKILSILSDVSRIRWVNHTFASMLYQAGYQSVDAVANADYRVLAQKLNQINKENNYYKGTIGLHDFKLTVDAAKMILSFSNDSG